MTYKYKKKEVPSSMIRFNCDKSVEDEFQVQDLIRQSKIKIGDTGSSFTKPRGRDIQIPTKDVSDARKIIKNAGCKVLSVKKDYPMKINVRVK